MSRAWVCDVCGAQLAEAELADGEFDIVTGQDGVPLGWVNFMSLSPGGFADAFSRECGLRHLSEVMEQRATERQERQDANEARNRAERLGLAAG